MPQRLSLWTLLILSFIATVVPAPVPTKTTGEELISKRNSKGLTSFVGDEGIPEGSVVIIDDKFVEDPPSSIAPPVITTRPSPNAVPTTLNTFIQSSITRSTTIRFSSAAPSRTVSVVRSSTTSEALPTASSTTSSMTDPVTSRSLSSTSTVQPSLNPVAQGGVTGLGKEQVKPVPVDSDPKDEKPQQSSDQQAGLFIGVGITGASLVLVALGLLIRYRQCFIKSGREKKGDSALPYGLLSLVSGQEKLTKDTLDDLLEDFTKATDTNSTLDCPQKHQSAGSTSTFTSSGAGWIIPTGINQDLRKESLLEGDYFPSKASWRSSLPNNSWRQLLPMNSELSHSVKVPSFALSLKSSRSSMSTVFRRSDPPEVINGFVIPKVVITYKDLDPSSVKANEMNAIREVFCSKVLPNNYIKNTIRNAKPVIDARYLAPPGAFLASTRTYRLSRHGYDISRARYYRDTLDSLDLI